MVNNLNSLLMTVILIFAFGTFFYLIQAANAESRQLTLTTGGNTFKIEGPSFENHIISEEDPTKATSINLNVGNTTINVIKGDIIDVTADFKLGFAATINVSLFQGTEVEITDGSNNIQFEGNMIPILELGDYPEGYTFQIKIPKEVSSGTYKMIILFNHDAGIMYYAPTVVVN